MDPLETAVITVGAFNAGHANNVIPSEAKLEVSVRAIDPSLRKLLETRIRELVTAQAKSYGVEAEINWRSGYAVLVNDVEQTNFARKVAVDLFGIDSVTLQGKPLTGSEDFAFMLEKVPGCYLLVGNGESGSPGGCMVHNPKYDFNDDNISVGGIYWEALVNKFLV